MWPGLDESPGKKGTGEDREADLRHTYKVEWTGLMKDLLQVRDQG